MDGIRVEVNLRNPAEAVNAILEAAALRLRAALHKCVVPLRKKLAGVIARAVRSSPEYASLVGGELRGHLGVVDAAPVLEKVIRLIQQGCKVRSLGARRVGRGIEGGLLVEVLRADYSEVLRAGGSFVSEGGYQIDWLRWLTLEGDRILVAEHRITWDFPHRSRTGSAIMVRPGSWRVPPEYAGTEGDNWLTRALIRHEADLVVAVQEEIVRAL